VAKERLVFLDDGLPVLEAFDRLPPPWLSRALGRADPLFSILGWLTAAPPFPLLRFGRQGVQGGVLAQTADEDNSCAPHKLQHGPLGIEPVGDDPQALVRSKHERGDPLQQTHGQFALGLKGPFPLLGQLGDVLLADVQHRPQRQGDAVPQRMSDHPGQGDPDVAIDELGVGRPGRGIVMDTCPLDLRPVALGGRVVQGQQDAVPTGQTPQQQNQQAGGNRFGLASDGGNEVIIVAEVGADSGGPQPTGHGSSPVSKEDTAQQDGQSPTATPVQPGRQPSSPFRPFLRTFCSSHPWLSFSRWRFAHYQRDGRAIFMEYQFSTTTAC
jgi:hypothetical protein